MNNSMNSQIDQAGQIQQGNVATLMGGQLPPIMQQKAQGLVQVPPQMQGQAQQPTFNPQNNKPEINPLDYLLAQAKAVEGTGENISLKSLKKREIDKIMEAVKKCKTVANNYYNSEIEPVIRDREENYKASEEMYKRKFSALSEQSNWRSRDIKTVCDWIMPSLIEAFTGSDDPVSIKGVNKDDDIVAKKIQMLIKYQLERKNSYFSFLCHILGAALRNNFGIAKVHWERKEKRDSYTMMWDIRDMQTFNLLQAEAQKGTIEITDISAIEKTEDLFKISFDKITVIANQPVIENLPASEFRYTPEATSLQGCKFVAHRKVVQGEYLKRKEQEGVFINVDKALEAAGDTTPTSSESQLNTNLESARKQISDNDNASKDIELYECYLKVDYNNDGILENVIVHCVEDIPIAIQSNEIDFIPFFPAQGVYDSGIIFPEEGYTDGLEQLQDLKTALVRQVIIAVAKNNIPQKYVNITDLDMDAILAGEEVVPYAGNKTPSDAIYIPPAVNISPLTMEIVAYAQSEIESQSGSTKYNQGLDSNSLNKTATGITAILGQADKRIKMLAKQLAENFLIPMFKYIILLNQKYAEPEQIFRLTNDNIVLKKDELDIDYDFIINVGEGAGTKQAQIQALMVMFTQLLPVLEQKGLATPSSYYSTCKDILEEMGLRNTSNYVLDPNSEEGKQKLAEQQQAQKQAEQQQLALLKAQKDLELEKAKTPKLSVQYRDLPTDAKEQLLAQSGIKTTPENVQTQEVINNA